MWRIMWYLIKNSYLGKSHILYEYHYITTKTCILTPKLIVVSGICSVLVTSYLPVRTFHNNMARSGPSGEQLCWCHVDHLGSEGVSFLPRILCSYATDLCRRGKWDLPAASLHWIRGYTSLPAPSQSPMVHDVSTSAGALAQMLCHFLSVVHGDVSPIGDVSTGVVVGERFDLTDPPPPPNKQ